MGFTLTKLPPHVDLETTTIFKKTVSATRLLAELKGVSATIPNQGILINTLSLQEAKDSSAVENIITTNDELFREELFYVFLPPPPIEEQRAIVAHISSETKRLDALKKVTERTISLL